MADGLNLCRIVFRFLNPPEQRWHRPRCSSQASESTASNSPSKHIRTSAGRAHAEHLTFDLSRSCERADPMFALVTRDVPVSIFAGTCSPFEAASADLTTSLT